MKVQYEIEFSKGNADLKELVAMGVGDMVGEVFFGVGGRRSVLLIFPGVNLYGVKASGQPEDILVMVKILIPALFEIIGPAYLRLDHLMPEHFLP